jgi:hypothetical protein
LMRVEPIHNCCCLYLSIWLCLRSFVRCNDSPSSRVSTASTSSHINNEFSDLHRSLVLTFVKFRLCHGEYNIQAYSQISRTKLS